jgi:predicted nucleic acid-binding protein
MADTFVLDASVAGAWILPDEQSEQADALYARLRASTVSAHAPELWWWECSNIIANGVKRARITPGDGLLAWGALDAVRTRIELASLLPAQNRACLALAFDLGLSVYDAAYLWLATSLKMPLLTHDARLAKAAARQKVAVLRVEDIE